MIKAKGYLGSFVNKQPTDLEIGMFVYTRLFRDEVWYQLWDTAFLPLAREVNT